MSYRTKKVQIKIVEQIFLSKKPIYDGCITERVKKVRLITENQSFISMVIIFLIHEYTVGKKFAVIKLTSV